MAIIINKGQPPHLRCILIVGKYVSSTCRKLSRDFEEEKEPLFPHKQLSLFVQAKSGKGKKEGQKTSDYSLHLPIV